MIQKWIKEQIEPLIPELEWSYDFSTAEDHAGVVYYEQPTADRSPGDLKLFTTVYTIQMESSKRTLIESWGWTVHDALDKKRLDIITIDDRSYKLIFLRALTPPGMIGIENRKSIYQVQIESILQRI